MDHLIWNCGSIDIFVISGEHGKAGAPTTTVPRPKPRRLLWEYLLAACGVSLCTFTGFILFPRLALRNLAMIYLLTVVLISSFLPRGPALFSSFLCVAAFAFFFVPKYYSFAIADTESAATLVIMLLVNTLVSGLAGTGREGLALAAAQVPEVVLLDLGLPDKEGLEVIKQLRGWSSVPIIILSARGQERDSRQPGCWGG